MGLKPERSYYFVQTNYNIVQKQKLTTAINFYDHFKKKKTIMTRENL